MKRVVAFVLVFLMVDRLLSYKLDQARRYARIEVLRKQKGVRKLESAQRRLAQGNKPRKVFSAQKSKSGTTTS